MIFTGKVLWTPHAEYKMKCYGVSRQRALGVLRRPERTEEGVLPGAIAVMQPVSVKQVAGTRVWRQEIWVMYVLTPHARVVSVWRYPGVSPKRNPVPADIVRELESGVD